MDNVNLILKQGAVNKLEVEAGENLLTGIVTEVNDNGTLTLSNENQCNWVRSYEKPVNVYLTFEKLDSLEYRSIGNVTNVDTLRIDTFNLKVSEGAGRIELLLKSRLIFSSLHYGTADIVLAGSVDVSYVYSASFGLVDNRDLVCNNVYVNNKSSNNLFVHATTTLGATVENIGDIYYYGNPVNLSFNQLGSGNLIKLD